MDYHLIGQRIRYFRKQRGLSQEQLAERVYISTVHMSHIETGSTKLSLPVLVDLARELQVRTDDLLSPPLSDSALAAQLDIASVLTDCSDQQARVLADIVRAAKNSMETHLGSSD